jgi:hypothetical protein
MYDQVKEGKICKWCYHSFEFHVKRETEFSQRKHRAKSYCTGCRGLCKGSMIKNNSRAIQNEL